MLTYSLHNVPMQDLQCIINCKSNIDMLWLVYNKPSLNFNNILLYYIGSCYCRNTNWVLMKFNLFGLYA